MVEGRKTRQAMPPPFPAPFWRMWKILRAQFFWVNLDCHLESQGLVGRYREIRGSKDEIPYGGMKTGARSQRALQAPQTVG